MTNANLPDNLLQSLGSPGKFQVFLFILLCTNAFPITFNFIFITFFSNVPPHYCSFPGNKSDLEYYIPSVKRNSKGDFESWDQCHKFIVPGNSSAGVEPCTEYTFLTKNYDWTIASEWDLVCDEKSFASLSTTIFFCGVMIGGLIFGTLADKYGRKPLVLITLYGQTILGIAIAFSPNYLFFVIFKFFQGSLLQGLQSCNNSLVMELFPLRYRTLAAMIYASCATSAHMMMALLLYLVPYWNRMQLIISSLTLITIVYSWLYPESIRWLLSQNRINDAMVIIKRFAKVNKITLPSDINTKLEDISKDIMIKSKNVVKYSVIDLFRTKSIRRYTCFLIFSWFSASFTYYGIQLYIPKMKGENVRYLTLFVSGAMETLARVVGYFIIDRIGRRTPLVFFFAGSGLFCIATGLVMEIFKLEIASNVLAVLGKLCSAQCFAFLLIYSSEIFPTVTRTIGLGTVACFTRIGAIVAPQILDLKDLVSLWLPFVIFGSFSLISSVLIFTMPETRGRVLPNSIQDVEEFGESAIEDTKKQPQLKNSAMQNSPVGKDNPALEVSDDLQNTNNSHIINEKETEVTNDAFESEKETEASNGGFESERL